MTDPARGKTSEPVVLVVEDEIELAELYANFLEGACDVRVANTGEEALERIDHSLDIVFLDRNLGDWTGDELVNVIRERRIDCGIVMVTAVEPDVDIVDLPVDDYLTKPIFEDDLQDAVEEILFRLVGAADRRELLGLVSRRIALEAQLNEEELETRPEYAKLQRRIRLADERLNLKPVDDPSKHRPETCPACDMRWDLRVGHTVGYVEMGSRVWKCRRCGNVANLPDPTSRWVARR